MEYIQLHSSDNVAVAIETLNKGALGNTKSVSLSAGFCLAQDISAGHKFALYAIKSGEHIIKFGAIVGVASSDIVAGEHVHTHNVKTTLNGVGEYHYEPVASFDEAIELKRFFDGYKRPDGKTGTRNELWVLSTVGCVSKIAERIALKANRLYGEQCDGVFAFTHPFGCSQTGDDHDNTRNITAALAQHANAGAVLIVGLGCENNQITELLKSIPLARKNRISYFNCQDVDDEIEVGLEKIAPLISLMSHDKREACPLSELVLGMKCGGSDGFSGLSANPLVGRITDAISQYGGTVLLTETPEMFGAEHLLMNRAESEVIFSNIVHLVNDFKQYFLDNGQNIYENPSPGNKAGGISTLEEKSMGAIQKGGVACVRGVLDYAQPVVRKGLNLLQAPGNDAVSSTALSASGSTLILFTTGRGTPLGFPAPTIKIASNTRLAKAKSKWIDFDAGQVFEKESIDHVASDLLDYIVEVASGQVQTKSELNEQREIAIWKSGVTL